MNTSLSDNLIAAIRAGNLEGVVAALDAGADCDLPDDHGVTGLPLRIAAYNGHLDIVRELAGRGANPNPPASLVALAVRGDQKETVRLLLELGAELPPGLQTGLTLREILAAQGAANRLGRDKQVQNSFPRPEAKAAGPAIPQAGFQPAPQPDPPADPPTESPPIAGSSNAVVLPDWASKVDGEIEEIQLQGCYGVDTNALNADVMRMAPGSTGTSEAEAKHLDTPPLDFDKLKFWKKKD